MRLMRWPLLLLVFLAGCRYTFWPIVPAVAPPPEQVLVSARLEAAGNEVKAVITVHQVPRAGYLELRWYRDTDRLTERSFFVEKPAVLTATLPYRQGTYHRLVLLWAGTPVTVVSLGTPAVPEPKSPPEP